MSYIFSILVWVVIIGMIFLLRAFIKHKGQDVRGHSAGHIFFSMEDALSQSYLLLALFFLALTLLGLNRELSEPLSWQIIILVVSALAIFCAYFFKSFLLLAFGLGGLLLWWPFQANYLIEINQVELKSIILLFGPATLAAAYYILGRLHDLKAKYHRFAQVYLAFGLVSINVILLFLSAEPGLDILAEPFYLSDFLAIWPLFAGFVLLLAGFFVLLARGLKGQVLKVLEAVFLSIFVLSLAFLNFLPEQALFQISYDDYAYVPKSINLAGLIWSGVLNGFLFAELLGLMFIGYNRRETWLVNAGAFGLFIFIIVKYFDWFFSFFDKGLFFIGAGLLLFVVGSFMEKKRRSLIGQMEVSPKKI
jgi:hypothetical protein